MPSSAICHQSKLMNTSCYYVTNFVCSRPFTCCIKCKVKPHSLTSKFKTSITLVTQISCCTFCRNQQFYRLKHEMLQSNSLKVKRPSSAITPTEPAVGRAIRWLKDRRLEAVYVVYEEWLMTRAISDTERHTLAAHLRSVSLPNTKCGEDWTLNMGSLCLGSKKEKDFLLANNPASLPSVAVGDWKSLCLPTEWMKVAKRARWLKTGFANVANQ